MTRLAFVFPFRCMTVALPPLRSQSRTVGQKAPSLPTPIRQQHRHAQTIALPHLISRRSSHIDPTRLRPTPSPMSIALPNDARPSSRALRRPSPSTRPRRRIEARHRADDDSRRRKGTHARGRHPPHGQQRAPSQNASRPSYRRRNEQPVRPRHGFHGRFHRRTRSNHPSLSRVPARKQRHDDGGSEENQDHRQTIRGTVQGHDSTRGEARHARKTRRSRGPLAFPENGSLARTDTGADRGARRRSVVRESGRGTMTTLHGAHCKAIARSMHARCHVDETLLSIMASPTKKSNRKTGNACRTATLP